MTIAELVELLTSSRAYQEGLAAQTEVMILNHDRVAEAFTITDVALYSRVALHLPISYLESSTDLELQ